MYMYFITSSTGYVGKTKEISIKLIDIGTNLPIVNAPIFFTTSIGIYNELLPVYTNSQGIAEVTLDLPEIPSSIDISASYLALTLNNVIDVLDIPKPLDVTIENLEYTTRINGQWFIRVKAIDNYDLITEMTLMIDGDDSAVDFLYIKNIEHVYFGYFYINTQEVPDGQIQLRASATNSKGTSYSEFININVQNILLTPRPLTLNLNFASYIDFFESGINNSLLKIKLNEEDHEYMEGIGPVWQVDIDRDAIASISGFSNNLFDITPQLLIEERINMAKARYEIYGETLEITLTKEQALAIQNLKNRALYLRVEDTAVRDIADNRIIPVDDLDYIWFIENDEPYEPDNFDIQVANNTAFDNPIVFYGIHSRTFGFINAFNQNYIDVTKSIHPWVQELGPGLTLANGVVYKFENYDQSVPVDYVYWRVRKNQGVWSDIFVKKIIPVVLEDLDSLDGSYSTVRG